MFGKLFGKGGGGQQPPSSGGGGVKTVDAIQKLGETEELLQKRIALLEKKMDLELESAKKYTAAKNQKAALQALKRKKQLEMSRDGVQNNLDRVGEQMAMLEQQRTTVTAIAALRQGAKASKATMSEMKVDDVDKVLDEINEQGEQMQAINDAMMNPIGQQNAVDDDELMNELADLEAGQLDEQLLEPAPVPTHKQAVPQASQAQAMPSVPTGRVPVKKAPVKSQEELELEALEKEMAA